MAHKIWFTADLHFDHANVIRYCNRPYRDTEAMAKRLAETWNSVVHPRDHVYVLGDVAFGKRPEIPQLNGTKFLVRGNHDEWKCADYPGWVELPPLHKLRHDRRRYVLCHYPLEAWEGERQGALHLHGHSHGNGKSLPRRLDVGVDAVVSWVGRYRPVSLDEVWGRLGA